MKEPSKQPQYDDTDDKLTEITQFPVFRAIEKDVAENDWKFAFVQIEILTDFSHISEADFLAVTREWWARDPMVNNRMGPS